MKKKFHFWKKESLIYDLLETVPVVILKAWNIQNVLSNC